MSERFEMFWIDAPEYWGDDEFKKDEDYSS